MNINQCYLFVQIPFNLTVDKDDLPPNRTNVETEKDLQKKINNIFNDIPKVPDLEGGEIIPQKTYIGSKIFCISRSYFFFSLSSFVPTSSGLTGAGIN